MLETSNGIVFLESDHFLILIDEIKVGRKKTHVGVTNLAGHILDVLRNNKTEVCSTQRSVFE